MKKEERNDVKWGKVKDQSDPGLSESEKYQLILFGVSWQEEESFPFICTLVVVQHSIHWEGQVPKMMITRPTFTFLQHEVVVSRFSPDTHLSIFR